MGTERRERLIQLKDARRPSYGQTTRGAKDLMELLTARQVADLIGGRSEKWIYAMAARGEIPCVRLTPGTLRFERSDIEGWIESRKDHGEDADHA